MPVNVVVLRFFGPVLILTGALGFALPPELALMSGAPPYNVFHIVFGIGACALGTFGAERGCRLFNIAFGAIDLYQAAASCLGWFPISFFRWTRGDDVAHVVIGLALIAIGVRGRGAAAER